MTFIAKRDCNWSANFNYSFKKGDVVDIQEVDHDKAIASGIFEILIKEVVEDVKPIKRRTNKQPDSIS